uniref:Fe2OG dioxygenase domain-containing protein n=1 Tax=Attheya septentrionalis TaxID=420275 RepID=A0A7S2UG01_9STRA|mmetsp:Transcript_23929/g.43286  ORF Transcript_23929/g.43286 Transcript_23929/m.43286 type:complete len:470 (+) Transcript_23929:251-1660(+)
MSPNKNHSIQTREKSPNYDEDLGRYTKSPETNPPTSPENSRPKGKDSSQTLWKRLQRLRLNSSNENARGYTAKPKKIPDGQEELMYRRRLKKQKRIIRTQGNCSIQGSSRQCLLSKGVQVKTRLVVQRYSRGHSNRVEPNSPASPSRSKKGTHVYAVRYCPNTALSECSTDNEEGTNTVSVQAIESHQDLECAPPRGQQEKVMYEERNRHDISQLYWEHIAKRWSTPTTASSKRSIFLRRSQCRVPRGCAQHLYLPKAVHSTTVPPVDDVVCVSKKHDIYIMDIGLTSAQCDHIVKTTEGCCRGNYYSYTYAKQTLGCREHDELAAVCEWPVMRACSSIAHFFPTDKKLVLDDREPHVVKYDLSKRERRKLDMHTDKSEWTFLISLSDGSGLDFDGGGTYFECIRASVHLQRGHVLVFPGKLRHRGQSITNGVRFLLVGFLVDKESKEYMDATQAAIAAATSDSSSKRK